jgi:hypothetical protein
MPRRFRPILISSYKRQVLPTGRRSLSLKLSYQTLYALLFSLFHDARHLANPILLDLEM